MCISDIFQLAEPILQWRISNAADSKTNNIVLVRKIYKRNCLSILIYYEIFVYRSLSKWGIFSNLRNVANQTLVTILLVISVSHQETMILPIEPERDFSEGTDFICK